MPRILMLLGLPLALILAGCGARGTPTPTVVPIPTPQAVYEQPTSIITPPAATVTPAAAGPDLALGRTVYEGKCASCHGEKGEGVPGKGKGVQGWTQSALDFNDILRTGGKGTLGNEHLYGPNQISPAGMNGLYAYVQSLLKK